jgi:hypothetical protein
MRLRLPYRGLISLALFAALCGILAYWAVRLLAPEPPVAPATLAAPAAGPVDTTRAAALFSPPPTGAAAPTVSVPVNLRIIGVMADESRGGRPAGSPSVALISIDGQAARPYAIGQTLPNGMRLRAIRRDSVELQDQDRVISAPTPATADLGVLTRGRASAQASTGAPPTAGMTDTRAGLPLATPAPMPVPAPMPPPGQPVDAGSPGATPGSPGAEAPMPPPPPIPASGPVPGPVFPPGSR